MERFIKIVVATALLLAGTALLHGQTPTMPGQTWGTFVHQVQVGPGVNLPALVNLNLDGSVVVASGLMFGGLPGSLDRLSTIHGVWRKTGARSVGATTLFFTFDANGILSGYQRNRCTLRFSTDLKSYQGTEFMETTACSSPFTCPDPLALGTVWTPLPDMPPTGFPVSGKRVQWLPAGPMAL
jgi:hypothetical protein